MLFKLFGPSQKEDDLLIAMLTSDTKPVPLDERDLVLLDSIVKEMVRTCRVDWDAVYVDANQHPKLHRVITLFREEVIDSSDYFAAIDFIYNRYPELLDVDSPI